MANDLLFSIVIPTYNRARFISTTIESILNQTYSNFEIIVVDDGGTDNTPDIVKAFADARIKYCYKVNEERAAARNFGAELAVGDYITFLDSDDRLYPNHLANAIQLIKINNLPEFIHLAYEIRSDKGALLSKGNARRGSLNLQLLEGNILSCIGVFLRKDVCKKHKFNTDRLLTGTEDYELWLRLASHHTISYNNEVSACIINHKERSVLDFEEIKLVHRRNLLLKYFSEDSASKPTYDKYGRVVEAHMNLYISLHAFVAKKYLLGFKYYYQAFRRLPNVLFTRKTLGIIKNIILNIGLR